MSLGALIAILIFVGVALYLVRSIPMDATIQRIITALIILSVVIWLLEGVGLFSGYGPTLRVR